MKYFLIFALLCLPRAAAAEVAGLTKVLLLGDSLTEGHGVPEDANYAAVLGRGLEAAGISGVTLRNAGTGGSTSASGLARLRWHLREKPKPGILVLALGANDGLRGLNLGVMKNNLQAVIGLAKKNDMKVLLAGMKIPPSYGREYAARFEAVYAELAREERVTLIPFLLEGVAADPKLNLPDGIHPNEEGYKIVGATVYKYLLPLLQPPPDKGKRK